MSGSEEIQLTRLGKYDEKSNFKGWINQFEKYTTLGKWSKEKKASLLFLSLTGGAQMYFVGLYGAWAEVLRSRFVQETNICSALASQPEEW